MMSDNLDTAPKPPSFTITAPEKAFGRIRRGDQIFIGAGCGEPHYLLNAFMAYADERPSAIVDAEVYTLWATGITPEVAHKYRRNFRLNSFFPGQHEQETIQLGLTDYTPISFSQVADLFRRKFILLDVALVQVSPPDQHGFMSLGVSVDVTRTAVDAADLVIAQVNRYMPRLPGDGYIHLDDVDFLIQYDEPLREFPDPPVDDDVMERIGRYVSSLINDGDTISVGYGSAPNGILPQLRNKRHLGVHTEFLSEGLVKLIEAGVVDNSRKTRNRGRTVASYCQGVARTYDFINENPAITLRNIDYTNSPLVIASHDNMVAINSATEIDLTGQATGEALAGRFFRGVGGQVDFMRGATLANNGRTILALPSTAQDDQVSRITPRLRDGVGVTFGRSDVQYVVTEYLKSPQVRKRSSWAPIPPITLEQTLSLPSFHSAMDQIIHDPT
jgi:acyl-CoA hydrolase